MKVEVLTLKSVRSTSDTNLVLQAFSQSKRENFGNEVGEQNQVTASLASIQRQE